MILTKGSTKFAFLKKCVPTGMIILLNAMQDAIFLLGGRKSDMLTTQDKHNLCCQRIARALGNLAQSMFGKSGLFAQD